MIALRITQHAIERFQERVCNVTDDQARKELSSPAVQTAAAIGAPYVRLGTGQRIVIENGAVITVLPKDHRSWRMGLGKRETGVNS